MQALLAPLGLVGGILVKMALQLVTEKFVKKVVILAAEAVVKRTQSEEDDKLVSAMKEAWGE